MWDTVGAKNCYSLALHIKLPELLSAFMDTVAQCLADARAPGGIFARAFPRGKVVVADVSSARAWRHGLSTQGTRERWFRMSVKGLREVHGHAVHSHIRSPIFGDGTSLARQQPLYINRLMLAVGWGGVSVSTGHGPCLLGWGKRLSGPARYFRYGA